MDSMFVAIKSFVSEILVEEFSAVELEQIDLESLSTKIALRVVRLLHEA